MCLKINIERPKDLDIISLHNQLYIKGTKIFRLDYSNNNLEDLEIAVENLNFNGLLYSDQRNYFYKIVKEYNNLAILYDPNVQNIILYCGEQKIEAKVELGFHSIYLKKESNFVFKQAFYSKFMEEVYVINIPVLINLGDIQLYGTNNELISKEIVIPNPDIVKEHFNHFFGYDYSKFYEKLENK